MESKFDFIFKETENIQNIVPLTKDLKKLATGSKKKKLSIDMRKLKHMDLAALQIFASFVVTCKTAEKNVILKGPLDPLLMDTFEEMDLIRSSLDNSVLFEQLNGGYSIES